MTTLVRGFTQPRIVPGEAVHELAIEQPVEYLKQLYRHTIQHLNRDKDPSARCALSITTIIALAHVAAGWRVAVANGTAGDTVGLDSTVELHELSSRESEDIGGGYALTRVISEVVSEYIPFGVMPSPRLGV